MTKERLEQIGRRRERLQEAITAENLKIETRRGNDVRIIATVVNHEPGRGIPPLFGAVTFIAEDYAWLLSALESLLDVIAHAYDNLAQVGECNGITDACHKALKDYGRTVSVGDKLLPHETLLESAQKEIKELETALSEATMMIPFRELCEIETTSAHNLADGKTEIPKPNLAKWLKENQE